MALAPCHTPGKQVAGRSATVCANRRAGSREQTAGGEREERAVVLLRPLRRPGLRLKSLS